jgi:hypothetical protein
MALVEVVADLLAPLLKIKTLCARLRAPVLLTCYVKVKSAGWLMA